MTLTEFLTARIDEDEEMARSGRDLYRAGGDSWHTATCGHKMLEFCLPCTCVVPTRILAECEARRQTLRDCVAMQRGREIAGGPPLLGARSILRSLALPYADHPDYQPEWKP